MTARPRILVIKLGALGDFVLATGPFAAIRRHHGDAHITLLTTRPFEHLARSAPYFDEVWCDDRPKLWNAKGWLRLRRRLREAGFARVYDLQTSDRSGWYFRLMGPGLRPEWSGIAKGCSHPHRGPERTRMHTLDRQREQLRLAGIAPVGPPDLSWLRADLSSFELPRDYVLLVPGGAPHRPAKRWPGESYAALASKLAARGLTPVVIGGAAERALARAIGRAVLGARDLAGHTSFEQIAGIARGSRAALGNDTGPMHLIVAAGCPALVLFSAESDPALTAPRGPDTRVLRRPDLETLGVEEVWEAFEPVLAARRAGAELDRKGATS